MLDRGPAIQTQSGRPWYPYAPKPEDVYWPDLLSQRFQCRFGGHVRDQASWYSNLEHGLRVGKLLASWGCESAIVRQGLGHDLHEVYPPHDQLGPVIRTDTPFAIEARKLSHAAAVCVRTTLRLPERLDPIVKKADTVMLATERRDLMAPSFYPWDDLPEPLPERVVPRTPTIVELFFVEMWRKHGGHIP